MKVLSVGMMVCDVPLFPVPSTIFELDTSVIQAVRPAIGGDALNVATTLCRLGLPTSIVGRVGADSSGDFVLQQAQAAGIDVSGVIRDERFPTVTSYVLIEENGERHTLSSLDLHGELVHTDITDSQIQSADLVYMGSALMMQSMDEGGIEKLFTRAHNFGKLTAMDVSVRSYAQQPSDLYRLLEKALPHTDIFFPSLGEMQWLTGLDDTKDIFKKMVSYGLGVFGIKLGGKGCILTDFKSTWQVETFEDFRPVDTTGAGDAFMGGFIRSYLTGMSLPECALFGNLIASHNITQIGATGGVPDLGTAQSYWKSKDWSHKIQEKSDFYSR